MKGKNRGSQSVAPSRPEPLTLVSFFTFFREMTQ